MLSVEVVPCDGIEVADHSLRMQAIKAPFLSLSAATRRA